MGAGHRLAAPGDTLAFAAAQRASSAPPNLHEQKKERAKFEAALAAAGKAPGLPQPPAPA
eukprot:SM010523S13925  [mRNA]  locus=s10523:2:313:- [translate_table: standard]